MKSTSVEDCLALINQRLEGDNMTTILPYWMLLTIRDCLLKELRRLDAETKALPALLRGDNVTE